MKLLESYDGIKPQYRIGNNNRSYGDQGKKFQQQNNNSGRYNSRGGYGQRNARGRPYQGNWNTNDRNRGGWQFCCPED